MSRFIEKTILGDEKASPRLNRYAANLETHEIVLLLLQHVSSVSTLGSNFFTLCLGCISLLAFLLRFTSYRHKTTQIYNPPPGHLTGIITVDHHAGHFVT